MDLLYNDLKFFPYSLRLGAPFLEKKGVHVSWINESNISCYADISPLQGYSQETLNDIIKKLEKIRIQKNLNHIDLYPSMDFALNHPLLEGESINPLRYQALVYRHDLDIKPLHLFKTLKIKINSFEDNEVISLIKTYSKTHDLRLDAERKPLSKKLLNFLIEHENHYDYIEEPLCHDRKGLKIALDETLYIEKTMNDFQDVHALIYKPTLCGGLKKIELFLEAAKKHHLKIILSSSYESSLGLLMLMKLHQELNKTQVIDIGLDTLPLGEPRTYLSKNPPYLVPYEKNFTF
jgi:O-succinylbenzoate synthase